MSVKTADLCDQYAADIQVAAPIFRVYGGAPDFAGQISTVQVYEDNVLVRAAFETPGHGRVLVVDGGGSLRCALVGDLLAALAYQNGWAGVVVHGCIRDSEAIGQIPIGVRALNTNPLRSAKRGQGQRDVPVTFAELTFVPGHYLYADADGIVVSERQLELAEG
ncbi:MAG: ribonuclease E activity regulator RraA [Kouleothrix sp.]|nr:ribonuclease E activity regulator RraA [Kouleothrix sp.]